MSLADPATLRTRVEETGLLWGLVGLVALLSLLPIGRLIPLRSCASVALAVASWAR